MTVINNPPTSTSASSEASTVSSGIKLPLCCCLNPREVAYHEMDLAPYAEINPEHLTKLTSLLTVVSGFCGGLDPHQHKAFIDRPSHLVDFEEKARGMHKGIRYFQVKFVPLKDPRSWGKWWLYLRHHDNRPTELVNLCQAFTQDPIAPQALLELLVQATEVVRGWAQAHQNEVEARYAGSRSTDPFQSTRPGLQWMQYHNASGVSGEGK